MPSVRAAKCTVVGAIIEGLEVAGVAEKSAVLISLQPTQLSFDFCDRA